MATNAIQATRESLAYALIKNKSGLIALLKRNGVEVPSGITDKQLTVALLAAAAKSPTFKNDLSAFLSQNLPTKQEFASFVADDKMFGFTGIDDFMYADNVSGGGSTGLSILTGGASTVKKVASPSTISSTSISKLTGATSSGYAPTGATSAGTLTNVGNYKPSVTLNDIGQTQQTGKTGSGLWSWLKDNLLTQENIQQGINLGITAIANKQQQKGNQIQNEAAEIQKKQEEMITQLSRSGNVPQQKGSVMTWVLVGLGVLIAGVTIYYVTKKKK